MKGFLEKIKTDKRTRNTVICSAVGAVIVIIAAIAIPVGVHSSNVKKALAEEQAAQIAVSDKADVIDDTAAASVATTESGTEEDTIAEVTAPATAVSTTQVANSGSASNNNTASNTGKGNLSGSKSGTGNSSQGASSKKPNEGSSGTQGQNTPPAQQETPVAPAQSDEHLWTQAEVDSLVAEIKAYAQSKGFTINSSLTTKGTSWSNPANTSWYAWAGDNAIPMVKSKLKDEVDFVYNMGINRFGYIPEESFLNIVVESCTGVYGETAWEIYVVY